MNYHNQRLMAEKHAKKNIPKVIVITHDAGGAEIIAAYVQKNWKKKDFQVYVGGPAIRVFRRNLIPFKHIPNNQEGLYRLIKKHRDVQFVLLGTGWMTHIEFNALLLAKSFGLKTVVYLESWKNYRERFDYPQNGWKNNLPSEIWVGDKYALVMAKRYFPNTLIRLVRNQYFKNVVLEYKELSHCIAPVYDILFLSDAVAGVEHVFEELLSILQKRERHYQLLLSFHPADDRSRYDKIIARYSGDISVTKSKSKSIIRDFLHSRIVIGTETVALVLSVLVGKKTISITTKAKTHLPFPQIIHVSNVAKIASFL